MRRSPRRMGGLGHLREPGPMHGSGQSHRSSFPLGPPPRPQRRRPARVLEVARPPGAGRDHAPHRFRHRHRAVADATPERLPPVSHRPQPVSAPWQGHGRPRSAMQPRTHVHDQPFTSKETFHPASSRTSGPKEIDIPILGDGLRQNTKCIQVDWLHVAGNDR